jgi:hypothetical protein
VNCGKLLESDVKHPIQPLELDSHGTLRFKANKIIRWLLDTGKIDLNEIAMQGFPANDHEQLAQLIGYSHSGASDLSYMSDEVIDRAFAAYDSRDPMQAQIDALTEKLDTLKFSLRGPISELYGIHEDDLYSPDSPLDSPAE